MKKHIIWSAVTISALIIGMLLSPRTQFVEKPVEVLKTKEIIIEKPVEVIKQVEKIVEVPAQIPAVYENALAFMQRFQSSKIVSAKESLAGINAVSVSIFLSDDIKKIVSESEIRTKYEITLRRSGVPIDPKATIFLSYAQEGFTRDTQTLTYSCTNDLNDYAYAPRNDGQIIHTFMTVWKNGNYGTVGLSKAKEVLVANAESAAEAFANDWLAMNPKK